MANSRMEPNTKSAQLIIHMSMALAYDSGGKFFCDCEFNVTIKVEEVIDNKKKNNISRLI